jgi:hypothetical protein
MRDINSTAATRVITETANMTIQAESVSSARIVGAAMVIIDRSSLKTVSLFDRRFG